MQNYDICCICLDEWIFEYIFLDCCNNMIHTGCLFVTLLHNNLCPLCRKQHDIKNYFTINDVYKQLKQLKHNGYTVCEQEKTYGNLNNILYNICNPLTYNFHKFYISVFLLKRNIINEILITFTPFCNFLLAMMLIILFYFLIFYLITVDFNS